MGNVVGKDGAPSWPRLGAWGPVAMTKEISRGASKYRPKPPHTLKG